MARWGVYVAHMIIHATIIRNIRAQQPKPWIYLNTVQKRTSENDTISVLNQFPWFMIGLNSGYICTRYKYLCSKEYLRIRYTDEWLWAPHLRLTAIILVGNRLIKIRIDQSVNQSINQSKSINPFSWPSMTAGHSVTIPVRVEPSVRCIWMAWSIQLPCCRLLGEKLSSCRGEETR
jgi:hypothetical protein